ncbi:TadE family type IV pilus minor pilin [Tessaracoccus caeni]|uniref:TadE family type IV pilus minor pilin n=1 Tax=Tessaracoccus caeni TaxID=3031239 RepID=UPI0023D9F731|nr:TadE family type IV pilus minor pilin [Tessaracoccus caeni]MDF1487678.1 TadE family type IV pilus minor pilin [Tessaracoccus caeni]
MNGRARLRQRGMVTVELAIGFVTATLLLAVLISLGQIGVTQAACAESSAQLARQEARGDQAAVEAAENRLPPGGSVKTTRKKDGVRVLVSAEVRVLGFGRVPVSAEAFAAYEPGEVP